ncbi:MAG: GNAT family N-acetyltransferase [Chloroflexota bacterium]
MTTVFDDSMLRSERLMLRRWCKDDAPWYVASRDEAVFQWTTERRELTVAETEAAIEAVNGSDDVVSLAIVDAADNNLLGNLALVLAPDEETAEMMYWLAQDGRGRGIATESVQLVSEWALATLGLKTVWLKTRTDNVASQRVAERAGYARVVDDDEASWVLYELKTAV